MPAEESKEPDHANTPPEKSGKANPTSPWTALLKEGAKTLAPVLLTGASLLGFVAFAGAVIVWTRFDAIEVPPDQAVKVVPQAELVATGSSLLLLFGLFGIFAVLATYLVDRGARATPGMARALLVLVAVEGTVAIGLVEGASVLAQVGLIVGFVFVVILAILATFHERFARYEDVLEPREGETAKPRRGPDTLYDFRGELRFSPGLPIVIVVMFSVLMALAAILVYGHPEGFWRLATWWLVARLGLGLPVLLVGAWFAIEASKNAEKTEREKLEVNALKEYENEETPRLFDDGYERPPAPRPKPAAEVAESEEAKRLRKPRPYRLEIGFWGICLLCGIAAAAVAIPAIVLGQWWLAVSFAAAFLLATGVWRVAGLSTRYFMWFGLAVFISVPLFGTLTLMARNVADPLVQPVAFIRSSDGPDEAIQGIYVTEASDRVYFANVATEGCSDEVKPESGHLLWVPKSEVVAMSIGPLQDVEDAGTSALEMAYGLTPSVETPAAGAVSLTVPEKKSKALEEAEEARVAKEAEAHAPQLDQRLENPGPAVRPDFGSGLSLVPEIASPGETVELRLSVPNRNSGGFGPTPHGRTLRLNGAPVAIAREPAAKLSEVEFVKTETGQELSIDKQGRYGEWAKQPYLPKPFLLAPGSDYDGPRYVRLMDGQVSAVSGGGFPGTEYGQFLRFHLNEKGQPVLEGEPEVTLAPGAEAVPLKPTFRRQAWDRDRISFEVPEHASSGVITVDCGQLAGQPLLRVAEPPSARIAVRMRPGSNRVAFDGAGSRAATGGALTERWKIGTQVVGKGPRTTLALPPRNSPYEVQLTVTDAHGKVDTAELTLLRLPASLFNFDDPVPRHLDRVEEERRVLVRAVRRHPPASIEVDGNADDPGNDSYNDDLSLRRAENLRKALLIEKGEASASSSAPALPPVPVTIRALGESCPIALGGGRQPANRRVEVFVLDPGVSVEPPPDCKAAKVRHTTW